MTCTVDMFPTTSLAVTTKLCGPAVLVSMLTPLLTVPAQVDGPDPPSGHVKPAATT